MLILMASILSCHTIRTIPLPEPAILNAGATPEETAAAIERGIVAAGWEKLGKEENAILAKAQTSQHMVAVRIEYGDRIVIRYQDSRNFGCAESGPAGCPIIHEAYQTWLQGLTAEIARAVAKSSQIPGQRDSELARPPSVEIGRGDPGTGFEQVGTVSGRHGEGCGDFGYRGTFEGAAATLKRDAARLGADYVSIYQVIPPHFVNEFCFNNEFVIEGMAYRRETPAAIATAGTCFAVSADGLLLTAYHVVKDSKSIIVRFEKEEQYRATVEVSSQTTDLAVLRISRPSSEYLSLATEDPELGEPVFTIGYAAENLFGEAARLTDGSISALGGPGGDASLVQISSPVHPGNSGGPLVTEKGEVVGIVVSTVNPAVFLKETGSLPQNINFATKAKYAALLWKGGPHRPPSRSRSEAIKRTQRALCRVEAR